MNHPAIKSSGPVLDAPDVAQLTLFYEQFLGWTVFNLEGPRHDEPPGAGWSRLGPADKSTKIEIQWEPHFIRPVYPGTAGAQGMQIHLDYWVEDVDAGVAWAIECGASEAAWQPPDRDPKRLRVMLDPAGHPFCLWS